MRSAGARSVPVWVALPIVVVLGAGGYAVISYVANDRQDTIASDHADSHGDVAAADGHDHDDAGAGHGAGNDQVPAGDRPRALVLGGFAAINGAVLVSAAVLRHRGRDRRRSRGGHSSGARRP